MCFKPFLIVTSDMIKPARPIYTGTKRLAFLSGASVSKISFCALIKIRYAIKPEIAGVTIQLPTIPITLFHWIASLPTATRAKPMMAPMIE